MIEHYAQGSSTAAWRAALEEMRLDGGDCVEFPVTPPANPAAAMQVAA